MEDIEKQKFIEKLSYVSKSKKQSYLGCPLAFKFSYIDKLEREQSSALDIGTDVHTFIENFFKIVELTPNDILGISKLIYYPNTEYKKNVVRFELDRWNKISSAGFDKSYFMPMFNETQWTTESPKLIGVVDRIHKCCKADPLAPNSPNFKDGDLVIVENKTGKPDFNKCMKYKEDFLWYKILAEIKHPELAPIRWGMIYFPYNNYCFPFELKDDDCRVLAKEIFDVRNKIINSINTEEWTPNPSKKQCELCGYHKYCEHKVI